LNIRIGEGETPDTATEAMHSGAIRVTPPRDGEDEWENFGD
jgi:hypothetical protein